MNKHIQTMKNALNNYQKAVKTAASKMEENNRLYKPEEAEKANAAIMARLKEDHETVRERIREAKEEAQFRHVSAQIEFHLLTTCYLTSGTQNICLLF